MWILWGILIFLALVVLGFLMLPLSVIVKLDDSGEPYFRYKILWMTFGEPGGKQPFFARLFQKPSSGSPSGKKPKKKKTFELLRENFGLIGDALKELVTLLGHCKAKKLKLHIVCADDDDAAGAALSYGACCALVMPVWGYLHTLVNVRPSGEDLDISCDYEREQSSFCFETELSVRMFRILVALARAAMAGAE